MSRKRKMAVALVVLALVAVTAVILLKTQEYNAGMEFYSGLR